MFWISRGSLDGVFVGHPIYSDAVFRTHKHRRDADRILGAVRLMDMTVKSLSPILRRESVRVCVLHITVNRSGPNHTNYCKRFPIRLLVSWTGKKSLLPLDPRTSLRAQEEMVVGRSGLWLITSKTY